MPKLPQITAAQLVKALESMGFVVVSQRGSHIKMRDGVGRTAIIPNHGSKILKPGTLKKGILNPLDISVQKLLDALKS